MDRTDLQHLLERAAYLRWWVRAEPSDGAETLARGGTLVGLRVDAPGRRLAAEAVPGAGRLWATDAVGEVIARCRFRWLLVPDDFVVAPGREPPPTALDPRRAQRFALLDGEIAAGAAGEDGLELFGAGRTFPDVLPGRIALGAVAAVVGGRGRFRGCRALAVVTGSLRPGAGLELQLHIRVVDLGGQLVAADLPSIERTDLRPAASTLPLHARLDVDASSPGLRVEALAPLRADAAYAAPRGFGEGPRVLRATRATGRCVGVHRGRVVARPGTFQVRDARFDFSDVGGDGGRLTADLVEGRALDLPIAGVPPGFVARQVAAVGPILGGDGAFAAARGLVSVVGVESEAPPLVAHAYTVELDDPEGRWQTAGTTRAA